MGERIEHEVGPHSHLSFLITGFIGAINKIGDAMIRQADVDTKGNELQHRLAMARQSLERAIQSQTKEE